jgi:hypothetical protein
MLTERSSDLHESLKALQHDRRTTTVRPYRQDGRWYFAAGDGADGEPFGLDGILDELFGAVDGSDISLRISSRRTSFDDVELQKKATTDVVGWMLYQRINTRTLAFASPALLRWIGGATPERLYLSLPPRD